MRLPVSHLVYSHTCLFFCQHIRSIFFLLKLDWSWLMMNRVNQQASGGDNFGLFVTLLQCSFQFITDRVPAFYLTPSVMEESLILTQTWVIAFSDMNQLISALWAEFGFFLHHILKENVLDLFFPNWVLLLFLFWESVNQRNNAFCTALSSTQDDVYTQR